MKSSVFGIKNGVRQGAVLSPPLFNLYIDDIHQKLNESGFGCQIEDLYCGCYAYADDISLIAPSREALQEMINMTSSKKVDYQLTFSIKKLIFFFLLVGLS